VDSVKAKLGSIPLYGLVNNAGVAPLDYFACAPDVKTLEDTLKVNYYLLDTTNAFFPLLDNSEGRVVHMSSAIGPVYVSKCSERRHKSY